MRNIKTKSLSLLFAIILAITFIGCGGGGGGSSSSFESEIGTNIVMCDNTNPVWTKLSSNDTITTTTNTQLKFDHDSNGNKQVCVVSGSATVKQ